MLAQYAKEYTEDEKLELEIKYTGLVNEILRTDYILFETRRQEFHDLVQAVIRRDETFSLIEKNGFTWRFKTELGPRREQQPILEIWNSEIKFGFKFPIRAPWFM